jgi:probable HAF family extracellular repeat protein
MTSYDFSILNVQDHPSGPILPTALSGVNNKGEIIGTCWGKSPISAVYYKGSGGSVTTFYTGAETNGYGINDEGMLVGRYVTAGPAKIFGFWSPGISHLLPLNPIGGEAEAHETEVRGVNNSRVIIGRYTIAQTQPILFQPFTFKDGHYTKLGEPHSGTFFHACGINDRGHVVGVYTRDLLAHAFTFKDGRFSELAIPGAYQSSAFGINNNDHIVGWYMKEDDQKMRGFVLADGELTTVEYPGSDRTIVNGINDAGVIVGEFSLQNSSNGLIGRPSGRPSTFTALNLIVEKHVQL